MNELAPSILIVEDETVIAAEIELTLRRMGYRIAGKARNGDKALDLLASTQPDLALLDIDIQGGRSGIDLANLIRQQYDYPYVFLTALADRATLNQVKETLPYGYIVKPFNDNDLLSAIELALHKHATERPAGMPSHAEINRRLPEALTGREYEVLSLLHGGLPYREVGDRLHIGLNTVKTYQKSLFAKLGVNSRHQLVQWVGERRS
ncbi:MAG: response regulator transcription factor [Bacteroidota bacterium]